VPSGKNVNQYLKEDKNLENCSYSKEHGSVIPAKAHGRQVKGDVPKAKAIEESPVQAGWKNQF
jgi:hypothetical protein